MSKDIKIKKGLDIKLVGEAEKTLSDATISSTYTIKPSDFHLVTPKMMIKEGAVIKAGEPIFYSKNDENLKFVSPVSGVLKEIKRGAKRVITALVIEADAVQNVLDHGSLDVSTTDAETIKSHLLATGLWPLIKQRPYDVVAKSTVVPEAIYVSGVNTAPLSPDYDFTLKGKESYLQAALTALSKLTTGAVHVSVASGSSVFSGMKNVQLHTVSGPHPAGNVGTLINKVSPVNKGEVVWTIAAENLVIIGELLTTGLYNAERIISVSGSSIERPKYYKTKIGASLAPIVADAGLKANARLISGNVLTGTKVSADDVLGYYHNEVVAIPEGDDYELFGWNKPVFNKISATRALTFSWLSPNKKYDLNTNTNGEHRAFVVTGGYEEVFPLDIYPMQILKACMVEDLDAMEQLGMYEVAPEDFALTEFVCISKQPHQAIIRKGLDLMYKEIG